MSAMRSNAGLTLVETLVATAATFVILAGLASTSLFQGRLLSREASALDLRENGRRVLEMIAREIRGAGFAPRGDGAFDGALDGIALARGDAIELRADRHGAADDDSPDGMVDLASDERISFYRNEARKAVYESVGGQILPLTAGVVVPAGGFALRYFDGCGGELRPPEGGELGAGERRRIRLVSIRLHVTTSRGNAELVGKTSALPRNRSPQDCAP